MLLQTVHRDLARTPRGDNVAAQMHHTSRSLFSLPGMPSLAYAVVQRSGHVSRYPGCLFLYWHGMWAVAKWAARHHGYTLEDSAVVVRTRPDVLLTKPVDIRGLRRYFAFGDHGRHLALGQAVKRMDARSHNLAQGDVHAVFSFGSYETDVALPFERAGDTSLQPEVAKLWWQRGVVSGWALGRSGDEWANRAHSYGSLPAPARLEAAFHPVGDLNASTSSLARCANFCVCLDHERTR